MSKLSTIIFALVFLPKIALAFGAKNYSLIQGRDVRCVAYAEKDDTPFGARVFTGYAIDDNNLAELIGATSEGCYQAARDAVVAQCKGRKAGAHVEANAYVHAFLYDKNNLSAGELNIRTESNVFGGNYGFWPYVHNGIKIEGTCGSHLETYLGNNLEQYKPGYAYRGGHYYAPEDRSTAISSVPLN